MKKQFVVMMVSLAVVACEQKKAPAEAQETAPKPAVSEEAKAPEPEAPAPTGEAKGEDVAAATPPSAPPKEAEEAKADDGASDAPSWPESFGKKDSFDEAYGELGEADLEPQIIFGLQRMSAKDTLAALREARPVLDALAAKDTDLSMPSFETVTDPTSYVTRAYPVGEHATFFLFRLKDDDASFEDEISKATLLYDRVKKEAAYSMGLLDWKRSESYKLREVGGVPMLLTDSYVHSGSCSYGGEEGVYAATPEGVHAIERDWYSENEGSTSITIEKQVVKITSMPLVKKKKSKGKFVLNVVEETCRLGASGFSCVEKIVKKGVEEDGCFAP